MERFQGPGACLLVERIIQEGTDDASQEKGQSCLFVLERYREGSRAFLSLSPFSAPATGQSHISPPDSCTGTKSYIAYMKYFCVLALFNSTKNTKKVAS